MTTRHDEKPVTIAPAPAPAPAPELPVVVPAQRTGPRLAPCYDAAEWLAAHRRDRRGAP